MTADNKSLLQTKMDEINYKKLEVLQNQAVIDFVCEYIYLCTPDSVFVRTDSKADSDYIREKALALSEEIALKQKGHTIHFDGVNDQARDKKNTKYLLPKDSKMGSYLNSIEKGEGLSEVKGILKGMMAGKEMYVSFFCLGPLDSEFSLLAVQITDSAYVTHSEDILYRPGYEQFKKKGSEESFFKFVHSAGELVQAVSKNVDKRRVYIDLDDEIVYSTNTQYAGNTVGLKKLSLRLAIQKASRQGWLAEHMFLMGVKDLEGKKAYFCGAYPSMCGKTSTAMIPGETIVGDDIAYLRKRSGKAYAVNVERGIFGIIKDVNAGDDPVLFKSLACEGEIIFSNILMDEKGVPFWIGKDNNTPGKGVNFSGDWQPGKTDASGGEIPPSHKNARYTISLSSLENVDENLESPEGVEIRGLIYGGRDSDTWAPVVEALSFQHGIILKAASLESETTAATLGKEGVRVFNPMSNIDFLSIPLGTYIKANLEFEKNLEKAPSIFAVNYFLLDKNGKFLNSMQDKRIWLKWIRLRVDGKVGALKTPTGSIPLYEDLANLFKEVLSKEYSKDDYNEQFKLRIPESLAKIQRIRKAYESLNQIPECLNKELDSEEERLTLSQKENGDYILPENFKEVV
jgi:phosphoenolpyruvate carboxykinase (GTP)